MPKIHELLQLDPGERLVNHGQAQIGKDQSQALLRAELSTFVCEGHFADGLQRILDRFHANRDGPHVEAAWVSGFFGSGKSHLLKMLAHLWANEPLSDGARPRGLASSLPGEIAASLRELDIAARRTGARPAAAAGTLLGGNERVRRTVLGIILRSRGFPSAIPAARFCLWLRDEGILDPVRTAVEAEGDWSRELSRLKVSRRIARAVLAARPDFEENEQQALRAFRDQFPPQKADLTTDQFVDLARQALSEGDQLPLTVLVLDEAQQYIGNSERSAADFTECAEALQTRFDGRVMLVASGQSALHATKLLQKLRDRFRIQIELDDTDVEAVTRQVLLRKKANQRNAIEATFEASEGEVSRHLSGTRLAAHDEDRKTRVEDYPLLASRRRFWTRCLRAANQGGSTAQLRSQLRILDDALAAIGDRELGTVIRASELFDAVSKDLVSSGQLSNEVNTRIQQLASQGDDGELRRNLASLAFLISKLPRDRGVDDGVRADASTLADLLVEDITADSGPFRQRVVTLLDELADQGNLLKLGEEYRIQTPEGAAWDQSFRANRAKFSNDPAAIGSERDRLLGEAARKTVRTLKFPHGDAKIQRKVNLLTGSEPPDTKERTQEVTVWLRSEWECSFNSCRSDARSFGPDDATLHAFVQRDRGNRLRDHIVDALTARRVLELQGTPRSTTGREAREAMESRLRRAETDRDAIVARLLARANVFQGGGAESSGADLAARLRAGTAKSLTRLFPRFDEADNAAWPSAIRRAQARSGKPFEPVGWDQDTEAHPVARQILGTIGPNAKGAEVRKELAAPPFGWPRDAVDAALIALHAADRLRATRNGEVVAPGALKQGAIPTTLFAPEQVVLTTGQKAALRGLFLKAGVRVASGKEVEGARRYLRALRELAGQAGGRPPLPPVPVSSTLDDAAGRTGNDQLLALFEGRKELERVRREWAERAARRAPREQSWKLLDRLHRHAPDLPVHAEVGDQLAAIRSNRSLLEATDPVTPLTGKLAGPLRVELNRLHDGLRQAVEGAFQQLVADPRWDALRPEERHQILSRHSLLPPGDLDLGTSAALGDELDRCRLAGWRAELDAVPTRLQHALDDLPIPHGPKPIPVHVPRRTIGNEDELRAWLEETERAIRAQLGKGPVILS